MVGRSGERLQMGLICSHAQGIVFSGEEDEIPPLAGLEANVVIGEEARKERSSGKDLPLEVKDWAVIDVFARLPEEPDTKCWARLHQGAQVRNDQPMRVAAGRPGSTGQARPHTGNERLADPAKRGKVI